jgi:hypothetical protein
MVVIVVETVVVMKEVAVVVVRVGKVGLGLLTVVIPVALVAPLVVQLTGLEKEQLDDDSKNKSGENIDPAIRTVAMVTSNNIGFMTRKK